MRHNPFEDMQKMHNEMDKIFSAFFSPHRQLAHKGKAVDKYNDTRLPVTDIQETENSVIASFEIPGASKDEIELNVTENQVEVKAEQKVEQKHEAEKGCCYTLQKKVFYRSLPLPAEVKAEDATAFYKNGILKVAIPKLKSHQKTKVDVQ